MVLAVGRNLLIYGCYLLVLGVIGAAVHLEWVAAGTGLVLAIMIAAVYAVFWPRW